ncbi:MAG: SDR family NAD(P)-dependent oxidoreductase [Kiritimatiellia bacterium]
MNLLDKVALVTGGAKRIGREIALSLANEGCDIVIHCNTSHTEADVLAREIRSLGRRAWTVCADFTNPYAPETMLQTAWELSGWIDILVNNASLYTHEELDSISIEDMENLWRINALAPLLLARKMSTLAAESEILPIDYCGRIINLLDRDIAKPPVRGLPYWMLKRSLADFTIAAARQLAPRFTVNAIAPGPVLPPENITLTEAAGPLPLGVRPLPSDIASAVAYLARAVTVTGQILYVDSGQHLL